MDTKANKTHQSQALRLPGVLVLAICAVFSHVQVARGQSDSPAALLADAQSPAFRPPFNDGPSDGYVSSFSPASVSPGSIAGGEAAVTPSPSLPAAPAPDMSVTGADACGGMDDFQRALSSECPTWGVQTFVSYDSWKGLSDDGWQNNGINVGANFGTRLGPWGDAIGLGLQIGGSVGVYDWSGTEYHNAVETQGFITYGFFRRPTGPSGWTAGIVQDWMLNQNFGEYSRDPTLSQLRGQIGYATSPTNEIGLWGAVRVIGSTRDVPGEGPTTWHAIDQLNLYWHHKWRLAGADSSIWVGIPEQDRLGASGSLGEYLAGASASVPLSERIALFTLITYMHPSSRPSMNGSEEEAWNFTIGLSIWLGRDTRSATVTGQSWIPLMPLANNGYFLVDTNNH